MQEFLRFIGYGFCHQLPLRSFEAGGLTFPVCARDTGIYLGFFFTIVVAFILYARHEKKPVALSEALPATSPHTFPAALPPAPYLAILALFVLPMAVDGVTSYLGLRETTNTIRYITGFFTGIAIGSLITPLLFAIRKDADPGQKVFTKASTVVIQLALTLALGTAFLFGYPYLGFVSPFFPVIAFLAILGSVNLILLTLSKRFSPRHTRGHWLMLLVICLALAFVEISVFAAVRELVVHYVFGGHDFADFLS